MITLQKILVPTDFSDISVPAIGYALSLAGVDDQWRVLTIGLLVIIAVSVDQWIRKVRA